jgi:hypothetical protein
LKKNFSDIDLAFANEKQLQRTVISASFLDLLSNFTVIEPYIDLQALAILWDITCTKKEVLWLEPSASLFW